MINSAAKWGLILGAIMSLSRVFETRVLIDGDLADFFMLSAEWLLAIVIYLFVIYRANREHIAGLDSDVRYGFREVLNYSILVSLFASFIVGIVTHIYIVNVVGGYALYAEQSIATISSVIAEAQVDSESATALMAQSEEVVSQVKEQSPSILSSVISTAANYMMGGLLSAIAIFWFVRRKPTTIDQNEQ